MSFRDIDRDEISEFLTKVETLDEILIRTAVERSEQLFGMGLSQDVVSGMYRRILSHPNRAYPPLIKLKIGVEKTGLFMNTGLMSFTWSWFEFGRNARRFVRSVVGTESFSRDLRASPLPSPGGT